MASVTLVNLNRIAVPMVAPYALDVLGSALTGAGHDVELLDLNTAADPIGAIDHYFGCRTVDLVGLTMRNTGDLYFPSLLDLATHGSYLGEHARLIEALKRWIRVERVVIGGVGFSSNPAGLLARFGLTCGVVGPGEAVICEIADALDRRQDPRVALSARRIPSPPPLAIFKGPKDRLARSVRRDFVDNRHYYDTGGLSGVRTSNGCGMACSYCIEPMAKGHTYVRRTADDVLQEIDQLVRVGINDIHTCDSEFNLPLDHAKEVLRAIVGRQYPRTLRFWAYCQPKPFDAEFARLLSKANVTGVNFGIDHTDSKMLRVMGKTWYTFDDIKGSTRLCHDHGIAVNHELLFGYPGDTPARMFDAIDRVMRLDAHATGIAVGLAVLPGTRLASVYTERAAAGATLEGFYVSGEPLVDPTFYVDPSFEVPAVFGRLADFVGGEIRRVMIPQQNSTAWETNQLVGSTRIVEDLKNGKRGAYWYHYPSRFEAVGVPARLSAATELA